MKSIGIVANYFGEPPAYFQLWLDSCAANPTIDWLLFTDIPKGRYRFPGNVQWVETSFEALKQRLQACFPFQVRYERPWDFCAFRPVLGTVFEKELCRYDFWGWCDCDLVFGALRDCFTEKRLEAYGKLLPKGHLSILRNDVALNTAIMQHPLVKRALSVKWPGLPCFDEVAFREQILPELDVRQCDEIPYMNPKCRAGNFQLEDVLGVHEALGLEMGTFLHSVYTWHDGVLMGWYAQRHGAWSASLPVAYCHFFRREMTSLVARFQEGVHYLIRPNVIEAYDGHVLKAGEIRWMNRPRVHWRYFAKRLNWTTIRRKLPF